MKRFLLLSCAIVFSVILCELCVRYIIGFPTFGVKEYITGLDPRGFDKSRIFFPYSRYYSLEGGYHVHRRNNFGLPGTDIGTTKKNILVLGSSFVEAMEVDPDKMASSVLNKRCETFGYQVVNIAYRGNTPYEQFCRLRYFGKMFHPDIVLLVLDSTYDQWYEQRNYQQIDPCINNDFGLRDTDIKRNIYRLVRNTSTLVNMAIPAIVGNKGKGDEAPQYKPMGWDEVKDVTPLLESIRLIDKYYDKLVVVSFMKSEYAVRRIAQATGELNVPFYHRHLKQPSNTIVEHFNEKGNHTLGMLMYESLLDSGLLHEATPRKDSLQ